VGGLEPASQLGQMRFDGSGQSQSASAGGLSQAKPSSRWAGSPTGRAGRGHVVAAQPAEQHLEHAQRVRAQVDAADR